jgi:DUF4097 and DUF4098 domain-containing protein YvlB
MRRALLFVTTAVLTTTVLIAASARAQTRVEQSRPASADGTVDIENMSGSVKVVGWDKNEVAVRGTLGRRPEGLNFSGTSARTHIEVETQGPPHGVRSDLEISVPAGSRVKVEGFDANITVTGVTGAVYAETVNGSITQSGAAKEVELQSVNGSVEVTKAGGRIRAESVNGAVTVREVSGEVEASTVNGELTVTGSTFERAHLEAVSGSIRFEGDLGKRAILEAETVSGSVELALPASVGADFEISTFSGDIENELGPAAPRKGRHSPEKELSFTAGSGGAKVTVQTLSGGIHLRKRP